MAASGLRKAEIERRMGWSRNQLHMRITGLSRLGGDEITQLAGILGCRIIDFYYDADQREAAALADPSIGAIAELLAGCTDAQRAAAVVAIQAMRAFARAEGDDGREA